MAVSTGSTQDLLVAPGHPTRRQILREINGGPPASPSELTERIDDTLSNVIRVKTGDRRSTCSEDAEVEATVLRFNQLLGD